MEKKIEGVTSDIEAISAKVKASIDQEVDAEIDKVFSDDELVSQTKFEYVTGFLLCSPLISSERRSATNGSTSNS